MPRGKFIVFEGLDGSGKSTQLERVAQRFSDRAAELLIRNKSSRAVGLTLEREPDDGVIGSLCRAAVERGLPLGIETQALANAAARSEHIEKRLLPALESGNHVFCDRYYYSNAAYNATPLVTAADIAAFNRCNAARLRPDATVYFRISPEAAAERISKRGEKPELYETLRRQREVEKNYRTAFALLAAEGELIEVDASPDMDEVTDVIWGLLTQRVFVSDADFIVSE